MPPVPTLTNEQRREAYELSLETRRRRALLKAQIADPSFRINFAGAWCRPEAQGMKVYDLLRAFPGIGEARAKRILEQAGIPERNTVRACGPRQRERLFELIENGPR